MSADAGGQPFQWPCKGPDCNAVVTFEIDDPRHQQGGALLIDRSASPRPRIVYIRCSNNHLHRYELNA